MYFTAIAAELQEPIPTAPDCSFSPPEQKKRKRRRLRPHPKQEEEEEGEGGEQQHLLPDLPDHLAQLCLARLPPRLLFSVCRSWRRLLYSPSFPPFLSLYALLCSPSSPSSVELRAFDPVAAAWRPLPHHPQLRHLILRHPAFLSRTLPVQSVAVAGRLVLLAGTSHALLPALPRPLVFDPATSRWRLGPPLRAPRRWCAAGSAGGRIYVASGAGGVYSTDVARSVERWDISSGGRRGPAGEPAAAGGSWERVAPLPDVRFSREAVEAVASGGKLCMVNVKGKGHKDGTVYDLAGDRWEKMPPGLLAGWTGPAASAEEQQHHHYHQHQVCPATTSASCHGGGSTIYVANEAEGELRAYDWGRDSWTTVLRSERLRGAAQIAVGGGRVCVAGAGGEEVLVVDVAARPARVWTVAPPEGRRVVALHVLPRMSRLENLA